MEQLEVGIKKLTTTARHTTERVTDPETGRWSEKPGPDRYETSLGLSAQLDPEQLHATLSARQVRATEVLREEYDVEMTPHTLTLGAWRGTWRFYFETGEEDGNIVEVAGRVSSATLAIGSRITLSLTLKLDLLREEVESLLSLVKAAKLTISEASDGEQVELFEEPAPSPGLKKATRRALGELRGALREGGVAMEIETSGGKRVTLGGG